MRAGRLLPLLLPVLMGAAGACGTEAARQGAEVRRVLAERTPGEVGAAGSAPAASRWETRAAARSAGPAVQAPADTAVFAGGCFWCMEPPYDKLEGVHSTTSGYAGGDVVDPTYEQVSAGKTGHREVVRVIYDPDRVGYERLLEVFWRNVDPLDDGGQFCDRGFQYTGAIFVRDDEQERAARVSKEAVAERFDEPVVTDLVRGATFYPAEEYHQDYYEKHPLQYRFYRWNCGRDARLESLWGEVAGGG